MNRLMMAIAAAIALPGAALAQATPAASVAAPAAHAGHDRTAMNCKDMHSSMSASHSGHQTSGGSGHADHSTMDHGKMDHSKMGGCGDRAKAGAAQAPANAHANHKQ